MSDKKRRTYMLTDDARKVVEWVVTNSQMNKSEFVVLAIRETYNAIQEGRVKNARLQSEFNEVPDPDVSDDDDSDGSSSFLDKLRGN